MKNPDSRFWRIVFLLAGLYTAGGVLPGIISPQQGLLAFADHYAPTYFTLFFFRALWITVFVFGIGYLIVAWKPSNHVGIVILGFLGKLLFAANVLIQVSKGLLGKAPMAAAIVDMVFVILFGLFILFYYSNRQTTP